MQPYKIKCCILKAGALLEELLKIPRPDSESSFPQHATCLIQPSLRQKPALYIENLRPNSEFLSFVFISKCFCFERVLIGCRQTTRRVTKTSKEEHWFAHIRFSATESKQKQNEHNQEFRPGPSLSLSDCQKENTLEPVMEIEMGGMTNRQPF